MFMPNKFSIYITKELIKIFLVLTFGLTILFFAVNFFEITKDVKDIENGVSIGIKVALFTVPYLLETTFHFIILLSGLFVFYKLSNNNEIVIMRNSGKSIFNITKFPAFIVFLFGIFVVTIFNPISSKLYIKSEGLKNIYFRNESEDFLELKDGIWFRQNNEENQGGKIIMRASNVYKNILLFNDVIFIFTDKNDTFIKRLNTRRAKLTENKTWLLTGVTTMEEGKPSNFTEQTTMKTALTSDFITKSIKNDYESIYNIPFLELRNSIKDLTNFGFDTLKFKVRYYYMMTIPFLLSIMIFISAYFGIINPRDTKRFVSIIKGIALGFIIFISHNIVVELTNARKLAVFDGSVLIVVLYIIVSMFLLLKKDTLSNYK